MKFQLKPLYQLILTYRSAQKLPPQEVIFEELQSVVSEIKTKWDESTKRRRDSATLKQVVRDQYNALPFYLSKVESLPELYQQLFRLAIAELREHLEQNYPFVFSEEENQKDIPSKTRFWKRLKKIWNCWK